MAQTAPRSGLSLNVLLGGPTPLRRTLGVPCYTRYTLTENNLRQLNHAEIAGLTVVFLWFFIGGIAHFVAIDTGMRLVPPWIPSPRSVVWVSGVFELLGAAGLLFNLTRRVAGIGLFILTICVTPVHIYMLQQPELFSVPYWALVLRLPLQVALLALIAWVTFRKAK